MKFHKWEGVVTPGIFYASSGCDTAIKATRFSIYVWGREHKPYAVFSTAEDNPESQSKCFYFFPQGTTMTEAREQAKTLLLLLEAGESA